MENKIENWAHRIDTITSVVKELCQGLDEGNLNKRANEMTWSLAQNIEHLMKYNCSYFPIFEALENGTYQMPFAGKIPFFKNFVGDSILRSVDPNRREKIKTFPIWEASSKIIDLNILTDFERHQSELQEWIKRMEQWIEERTVIHSPANTKIVYRLDKAIEIIVRHEERHLKQIVVLR